ncbi:arsenic transporter [Schinkia azotoformans]|uniref:Arsenical pump membrane protein n=1 Tax=Schinkia azotoformans LMG 9581 TaxID=1131731 RepID=K6DFX1_SCHAZ|nr:arsenic transporter [Schinkia azotoformans]EKN67224.1 Arsenical pump membrane protein [Schinkia azotoformans LMG 9581]MEC1639937.1 arsenic transporter [Schinkia azotoformans]MEC1947094.1 arsenic transporter [Schinkia azotoformans]
MVWITILTFFATLIFILWRPRGLNEAVPATIGALIVILCGSVPLRDLEIITETISGAAITIMATIVMAIVLESFGFFNWVAEKLAEKAKGSGIRLFWYVNLLCFLMTLFFNNDGSILITTPILIMLLNNMGLKNHEKIPYLLSGAVIATASSAPIGVSNIVNLIALKIVDMSLYMHTAMMFVPATLGLLLLVGLLFLRFKKALPKTIPANITGLSLPSYHPLKHNPTTFSDKDRTRFMINILLFVFAVRVSLFVASFLSIPVSLMAVIGSLVLLGWRWAYLKIPPGDMLKKTPWYIIVFAFSMYVIIYGLNNIGLTDWLIGFMRPLVSGSLLHASVLMGVLLSVLSNLFNNHPALMIGTITLTNLNLDLLSLKISYLASVIGSDVGSLILPMGTLATLMWMHIVRRGKVVITWWEYIKITIVVIPPVVIFTLVILYYWVSWLFV